MKAAVWIDRVKVVKGLESDYAVAKALGLSRATVSNYRVRTPTLDEDTALKVAHALDLNPAIVLADQAMERARDAEARSAWGMVLDRLGGVAASILLGGVLVVGMGGAPDAQAAGRSQNSSDSAGDQLYIVERRKRRRKASWLSGLFAAPVSFAA